MTYDFIDPDLPEERSENEPDDPADSDFESSGHETSTGGTDDSPDWSKILLAPAKMFLRILRSGRKD